MRSLSYTGPPQYLEDREFFTLKLGGMDVRLSLHYPLRRICFPHRAAASGMGDSTSLPAGFQVAVEAQLCEGSAELLLGTDVEVAKAWAARSR